MASNTHILGSDIQTEKRHFAFQSRFDGEFYRARLATPASQEGSDDEESDESDLDTDGSSYDGTDTEDSSSSSSSGDDASFDIQAERGDWEADPDLALAIFTSLLES